MSRTIESISIRTSCNATDTIRNRSDPSYDSKFFHLLMSHEDRHFWFRSRNDIIADIVTQISLQNGIGLRILEAGCGNGNVLRVLEKACARAEIIGTDAFEEGLRLARKRTSSDLVRSDLRYLPFRSRFDLICLLDTLEHLPDDLLVMRQILALLNPGGVLLLTVPAHMLLWSEYDLESGHYRRYSSSEIRNKLRREGFQVEYETEFMASIFPLVLIKRKLLGSLARGRHDESELEAELEISPAFNRILTCMLGQERRVISHGSRFPVGTSLLVLARRPVPQVIQSDHSRKPIFSSRE